MKTLLSCVLFIITAIITVVFAQSESSAIKTIKQDNINVTEPMIAVNPTDPKNFITVYSNWSDGNWRIPASSWTTDGGETWTYSEVPDDLLGTIDQADPTIAFDANGVAHYCYLDFGLHNNIMVAHSTNKGATWYETSAAYDDQNMGYLIGYPVPDKPWIAVDGTNGSPYKNTLYVVWTSIVNYGAPNAISRIYLTYKRAGQETFSNPIEVSSEVQLPSANQGAFPVVGTDGTLYIFRSLENINPGYSSQIMMRKSINGGQSFTGAEQLVKNVTINPEGQILGGAFKKAHGFPYVAVSPLDGSLNLVYGDYKSIYFSRSTNNGVTWSTSSMKGMKPSGIIEVWNPMITCNSKGKLAIVYYATGSGNNTTKVYVATGYATDPTFTIRSQGAVAFNPTTWKYTDYIGIACNDFTYWGVWPAPQGSGTKIVGRYRTIGAVVENLDQDNIPFSNSKIYYDDDDYISPYTTATNLIPGKTHTLRIFSSQIIKNGNPYDFYRWEDETGSPIGTTYQITVNIDNHRYRAMFSYNPPPPPVPCTLYVKNEFKDPNGTTSNGGIVNIDYLDFLNTENLPGQQVTRIFNDGDQHRFEAKEQTFGSYYRGFNPYPQFDNVGWRKDNFAIPGGTDPDITVSVHAGTYTAKYRNRYNVYVNGFAQELNSTVSNIIPSQSIWQYESIPISAPLTQLFPGGITGKFLRWSDGITSNSRTVSLTENTTYTAQYKAANYSNTSNTFSNSSQKKVAYYGWKVYESLGNIWLEKENLIMNGGLPVNDLTERTRS